MQAAAKHGKAEMVRMLLGFDADVLAVHEGQTPLALAESRGHSDAAKVLRKAAERRAARAGPASDDGLAGLDCEALQKMEEAERAAAAAAAAEAAAAAAAAAAVAEKKAAKRARQRARKREDGRQQHEHEPPASKPSAAGEDSTSPEVRDGRRADALLASRALAELSVEAARKMAREAAVEKVAAAVRHEEVSGKLRGLAGGAARSQAAAQAIEEYEEKVAAAARQGEVSEKLRALARSQATARAVEEFARGGGDELEAEDRRGARPAAAVVPVVELM